jgi:hypothetical protein
MGAEKPKSVGESLKIAKDRFKAYREEVTNKYAEKKKRIGELVDPTETDPQLVKSRPGQTAKSEIGHDVASELLEDPIEIIERRFNLEWNNYQLDPAYETATEKAKFDKLWELRKKYEDEAKLAVKISVGYIDKMTQSSKNIDAETLAEMRYSLSRDIKHFSEILGKGEHKPLMDAYMWVLGLVDPSGKEVSSLATLEGYLLGTENGAAEVEDCTWLIISFMQPSDVKDLMIRVKSKMTTPGLFEEKVIEMGVKRGVISTTEAQSFGITLSPSDEADLRKVYTEARDFTDEARSYARESYGATSIIHKMFTGPYLARNLLKGLSFVTAGVNLGVGAWGGGFKGFMSAITGSYFLPAAGVYAGIKAYESNTPFKDFFEGDKIHQQRSAQKGLALKMEGPYADQVSALFDNKSTPGLGAAFHQYISTLKTITKTGQIPPLLVNKESFADYLQKRADFTGKPEDAALVAAFNPISKSPMPDKELFELAIITSTLKVTEGKRFASLLEEGNKLA